MRKHLISFFLLSVLSFYALSIKAQVVNYSALFTQNSTIHIQPITELNGLASYTVQFWMNPSVWHSGASVYTTGYDNELFSVVLGTVSGELVFYIGRNTVKITDAAIKVNAWTHFTFINREGNVKVFVNNIETAPEQSSSSMSIPNMASDFILGDNGYEGRIDEFRIWNTVLDNEYFMWDNTINKYHPQWDNLVVYYKFDQDLCENLVDYKFKHHGTFVGGTGRQAVTDNGNFIYRKICAYTDFSRYADRTIDYEKYLLANELIVLGVTSDSDGNIVVPYPDNSGKIMNGEYLSEYQGRTGVLSLKGSGASMNVGSGALIPLQAKTASTSEKYSFQTWVYLESWTEGAFLFKKEASTSQGFSIRLGEESSNSLIVRINGDEYEKTKMLKVGEWTFIGVTLYNNDPSNTEVNRTFMFTRNTSSDFATKFPSVKSSFFCIPQGVAETNAFVGENLNAKLDNTVIYHKTFDGTTIQKWMNSPSPVPDANTKVDNAGTFDTYNSWWSYDSEGNLGFDSYSYKNYISIMHTALKNHRGQKTVLSVKGHDGWQNTFANAAKRTKMAKKIAEIAMIYDGIDLDFEWIYGDVTQWNNYGALLKEIREEMTKLDPNKQNTLSVSLHNVSRGLPKEFHQYVDEFTFQQYGPSKDQFSWTNFTNNSSSILNSFDPSKVILSFATTTSKGYKNETQVNDVTGIRQPFLMGSDSYSPEIPDYMDNNGVTYYFTGVNQTKERCQYVKDNKALGIFYWDMGNDLLTSHKYSLARHASYVINSNVDTLVVDIHATSIEVPQTIPNSKKALLSPNPAKNDLTVLLPQGKEVKTIKVFDMMGRNVLLFDKERGNVVNVAVLPVGNYIVSVTDFEGEMYSSMLRKYN